MFQCSKPWHDSGMQRPLPPWTLLAGLNYEFEVDCIIDHDPKHMKPVLGMSQKRLRACTFKVRWRFMGPGYDTWEPSLCLKNAQESLAAYLSLL